MEPACHASKLFSCISRRSVNKQTMTLGSTWAGGRLLCALSGVMGQMAATALGRGGHWLSWIFWYPATIRCKTLHVSQGRVLQGRDHLTSTENQPGLWEIRKGSNEAKLPLSYEDTSVFAWCQLERHPVINSIVKERKKCFSKKFSWLHEYLTISHCTNYKEINLKFSPLKRQKVR